jgi:hypothetical protein
LVPVDQEKPMSHSPPVPPGNQSPYPRVEPPHEHRDAPVTTATASSPPVDRASSERRIRTGIAAALGIGAVAALVAGIVAARRQPPAPPPRRRKSKKKR